MRPGQLAERTNRKKLLSICLDQGLSQSAILHITEPMTGKTHEEREQIAAELLLKVEAGEFNMMEQTDYSLDRR